MTTTPESSNELIARIRSEQKNAGVDLSTSEDLSLAVMNLVSLEEHFFFTAAKTGKDSYFDTMAEIRSMRKELLAKLMPNHEGETWCSAKHLLSASMRLIEVGTKLQTEGKENEAVSMFQQAYRLYSIFWALKLKLVEVKPNDPEAADKWKLEDLVSKLADCCKE